MGSEAFLTFEIKSSSGKKKQPLKSIFRYLVCCHIRMKMKAFFKDDDSLIKFRKKGLFDFFCFILMHPQALVKSFYYMNKVEYFVILF